MSSNSNADSWTFTWLFRKCISEKWWQFQENLQKGEVKGCKIRWAIVWLKVDLKRLGHNVESCNEMWSFCTRWTVKNCSLQCQVFIGFPCSARLSSFLSKNSNSLFHLILSFSLSMAFLFSQPSMHRKIARSGQPNCSNVDFGNSFFYCLCSHLCLPLEGRDLRLVFVSNLKPKRTCGGDLSNSCVCKALKGRLCSPRFFLLKLSRKRDERGGKTSL